MKFIPHSLTPVYKLTEFGVWLDLVIVFRPLVHPVLYLRYYPYEAIPQYISRKTSYLPV